MSAEKAILLVEDDPDHELLTLRALKQSGISSAVNVARDGAEALFYLFGTAEQPRPQDRGWPYLILLDLKLPKVDGTEVIRRVREDPRTACIPIIVLTSSDEDRDIMECYRLCANSYIRKPMNLDNFAATIRQIGLYWLSLNQLPSWQR